MSLDWPFLLVTAVRHCPSVFAPSDAGVYCRVFRPMPARRRVFAQSTLQLRQVQIKGILPGHVLLVPVDVADFDGSRCATETAALISPRRTVSPVTEGRPGQLPAAAD